MYKILRNIHSEHLINNVGQMLAKRSLDLNAEKQEHKEFDQVRNIKRISHNELVSFKEVNDIIFSENLFKEIKRSIGNFKIINLFSCQLNAYGPQIHRDGQGMGFEKFQVNLSSKIFKVCFYFTDNSVFEGGGIRVSRFNSRPFNFVPGKKLWKSINYRLENFKKKFLINLLSKAGDAILFDSNVWHSATPVKKLLEEKFKNTGISKILLQFEIICEKDQNKIDYYINHLKETRKMITNKNYLSNESNELLKKYNVDLLDIK